MAENYFPPVPSPATPSFGTRRIHRSLLHALLLQSAASAALLCLAKTPAFAACVLDGDTVRCTGNSGPLSIPPPPGPSVIVEVFDTLNGGIGITGLASSFITNNGSINGNINVTGSGNFTFLQNGIFGATAINVTGTGTNTLFVNPGRSVGAVTMTG